MGSIVVTNLGKAYKQYPNRWARLAEWAIPRRKPRHSLHWVLQDISFTVNPGEAIGIIGVNGAGKSTLLKMITGTTQPTTGSVSMTGRVAALLELGMGFHPDFTGRQNAYMGGQLLGYSVEEITQLLPGIEAFAGIGEYIDQPVRIYSSGMQVRLAFAVATASRPDILVIDEALAVGDIFFQQKCFDRIRSYCEAGSTLLFVSHSPGIIYSLCDRAILLSNGRLTLNDTPQVVIDFYNAITSAVRPKQDAISEDTGSEEADLDIPLLQPESENCQSVWRHSGVRFKSISTLQEGREVNVVFCGRYIILRLDMIFTQTFDDPHIGFRIHNNRGEPAFMTTTMAMKRIIGPVVQEDRLRVEFGVQVNLAPGEYTLTFGVANGAIGDMFREQLARLMHISKITVINDPNGIKWDGHAFVHPTLTVHRTSHVPCNTP